MIMDMDGSEIKHRQDDQNVYVFMIVISLLHSFSSEPSEQSGFPSHIHVRGMHSPLVFRQVNSSVLHTRFSGKKRKKNVRPEKNSCKMIAMWGK